MNSRAQEHSSPVPSRRQAWWVLVAAYAIGPDGGTEAGSAWQFVRDLAQQVDRITVVTTDRFAETHAAAARELPGVNFLYADNSVPWPFNRGRLGVYLRHLAWQTRSVRSARVFAATQSSWFDVVHHLSWGQAHFGSPLVRLRRPFVFGPVGGGSTSSSQMSSLLGFGERCFERLRSLGVAAARINPLLRLTLRRTSEVFAANADTERMLSRFHPRVRLLLPDTAPTHWLRSTPEHRILRPPIRVLWVGRFLPRKGPTLAVHVAARLPEGYHLRMLGSGSEFAKVQSLVSSMGLNEKVHLVGSVPREAVIEELDAADVFLFTSVRDTSGTQLIEASCRGLPIVAIRQHGVADFITEQQGFLAEVAEPAELAASLAQGIEELCADPRRLAVAREASLEFACVHTNAAKLGVIMEAYGRAIESAVRTSSQRSDNSRRQH